MAAEGRVEMVGEERSTIAESDLWCAVVARAWDDAFVASTHWLQHTSGRVRALELLGKLTEVGAFAEQRIDISPRKSEREIEQEIADLLERLQPKTQEG